MHRSHAKPVAGGWIALLCVPCIAAAAPDAALVAAAQAEAMLTTIALPRDWCGYGAVIDGFKAKYPGITVNELAPGASSDEVLQAVRAGQDRPGPTSPDVLDLGPGFARLAMAEGLTQPYKVAPWASLPPDAKEPDGHWVAGYYGVVAFAVNTDIVKTLPGDWSDLSKPEYKGAVALAGHPMTDNQAALSVMSAGVAMGTVPGGQSAETGLRLFAELRKAGIFVPVAATAATIAQGISPIVVAWDYTLLAWRDQLAGNPPIDVYLPGSGSIAVAYVQVISAHAPHPNAARLWMEYLYSDEGQLGWLRGYCHPIRFSQMVADGAVPQDLLEALPPAAAYDKALFPTLDQQAAHRQAVIAGWEKVVGTVPD